MIDIGDEVCVPDEEGGRFAGTVADIRPGRPATDGGLEYLVCHEEGCNWYEDEELEVEGDEGG